MLESHAMTPEVSAGKSMLDNPAEESAGKSILDRPLHQLTEDDVAQLTREDCRRYLKEKGMRRPSWNKSQAIQQVIMLKKLLEVDSEAGRPNTATLSVPKVASRDEEKSVSVEEAIPRHRINDLNKPDPSGDFSGHFASAKDESTQPRTAGTTNIAGGQMTIFYRGKVNVYDEMPLEKARTIMHLAAIPLESQEEELNDSTKIQQPLPCLSRPVTKMHRDSADVILPTIPIASIRDNYLVHTEDNILFREETPVEGSSTRKASVQRYLEKRKDRFKSKRKAGTASCSSLDVYLNHQMGSQILRVDTCSPTQIRQPSTHARCSSVDNDPVKNVCASTGLINKGLQVDST